MFEWLASHRIDEYWFRLLGSTLDTVQALPVDTSAHVTHGDWDRLAAAFGRKKRSLAEAEAVFYKGQGRQRIRAGGLLSTLSDDEYARVCKFIVDTPTISFPTPHRIKRAYMRYLGYMMYHVIAWFDPLSAAAASAQAHTTQNKTLLHTHLEAAPGEARRPEHATGTDTLLEPSGTAYTEAGAGFTLVRMRMNFMNAPCRLLLLGRSLAA
ncbi:unnamed protein product, partial [Clonostachys rosea f. rosea IK726]